MKKIFIFLSIVLATSCSLLPDNESRGNVAIKQAESEATDRISQFTDNEVVRARGDIDKAITEAISKADTTLNNKLQAVKRDISSEADATRKELSDRMQGIEDSITKAYATGIFGFLAGFIGILLAIIAYRKRPKTNVTRVRNLIEEEINQNAQIRHNIKCLINDSSNSRQQSGNTSSQLMIERAVEAYVTSKKFKDLLINIIGSTDTPTSAVTSNVVADIHSQNSAQQPVKMIYELFAKESSTMTLSNIQNSYQKGKSIYKLVLMEPNSNTSQVSLCIDQEEAKQRILRLDSQYLEPICIVTRSSSDPSEIIIKSTGSAERIGEEWKVVKPVNVEIK